MREVFSVYKSLAESLFKNVSVDRGGVIFFSLRRFRLVAKISKGGSQTVHILLQFHTKTRNNEFFYQIFFKD